MMQICLQGNIHMKYFLQNMVFFVTVLTEWAIPDVPHSLKVSWSSKTRLASFLLFLFDWDGKFRSRKDWLVQGFAMTNINQLLAFTD